LFSVVRVIEAMPDRRRIQSIANAKCLRVAFRHGPH
jgi:hypothetical protein